MFQIRHSDDDLAEKTQLMKCYALEKFNQVRKSLGGNDASCAGEMDNAFLNSEESTHNKNEDDEHFTYSLEKSSLKQRN